MLRVGNRSAPTYGDQMKKLIGFALALALSTMVSADDSSKKSSSPFSAPVVVPKDLSKDQTDSCEAVLCLAGGKGIGECLKPLRKYYSLKTKYRANFLKICPKN